jgi:hypothetical protein
MAGQPTGVVERLDRGDEGREDLPSCGTSIVPGVIR